MVNKIYLDNPYLREIEARITSKVYENGKYYLKLNRTIFYPHLSGGQPGDKGTINGVEVLEVYEENSEIIHVIKENINSDKVTLNIDWENRLDNMQQHTGQHLLSAAFYKLYNGETVGFHIGQDYVYIDVTLPELTEEEADKIELYANRIITSNFEIKSYYIEENDVEKIPVRKKPTVNSNIRIVEIDNIDFSPCAGTHLGNTGELGLIKIRKWEKYKGNIRVEFACGLRAFCDYSWKHKTIKDIALMLSSKDTDVLKKVQLLYQGKEELEKENRNLKEEIYSIKGEELLRNSIKEKDLPYIIKTFDNMDIKELSALSMAINNKELSVQIFGSTLDDKGHFLISIPKEVNVNLRDIFKDISEEFDIKGGGSPLVVQGGCNIDILDDVLNKFFQLIKESNLKG